MPHIPWLVVGNGYRFRPSVIALDTNNWHRKRHHAVGGRYLGSIAVGLLRVGLLPFYGNLLVAYELAEIGYRGKIRRCKESGRCGGLHALLPKQYRHQDVVFKIEVYVAFVEGYTPFAPVFGIYVLFKIPIGNHQLHDLLLVHVENLLAEKC